MTLATFWFILIAVLWTGYFFLDGFDFGVGMLLHPLGRDEVDRRVMLNTIGPVWDANEVWLLTAGGATFAAFPLWYATMFSGFYLPLFLVLVALILRGVAFEYRGKMDDPTWRSRWDLAIAIGSWVPPVVLGVAFGNIVHGLPIDSDGNFTGSLLSLFNPFALLGGLALGGLCLYHGANFLALKTEGRMHEETRAAAERIAPVSIGLGALFLLWNQLSNGAGWTWLPLAVAAGALIGSAVVGRGGSDGWAFALTGVAVAAVVVCLFGSLYPDVMPSTTNDAYSLTVDNASSSSYTLTVMSWVAVVMTPVVIAYQAWSYWVFRRRIGRRDIPTDPSPVSVAT